MILEEFWETKQQSHVNNNFIAIFYCSVLRGKRTIPVLFLSSSIHKSGPRRKLIDDSVVQEYRFCQVSSCMGWFNSCTCSLGLSLSRVWQRVASVGISDLQVLMNFMNLKLNQNQHRWADNCWFWEFLVQAEYMNNEWITRGDNPFLFWGLLRTESTFSLFYIISINPSPDFNNAASLNCKVQTQIFSWFCLD